VADYLDNFIKVHGQRFGSVRDFANTTNMGCYTTCQVALDHSFALHPFVIFAEDDVVFSADALLWFDAIRRQKLLDNARHWAIAGESVFFNASDRPIPEGWPDVMKKLSRERRLADYYITHNFMPSTCFATTRAKWAEFGATRGLIRGDCFVNERCKAEDKHTIFPVVPRVKDVGMLHENGFSVMVHTLSGVTEIKNTYVMAEDVIDDFDSRAIAYQELTEEVGPLYARTTKLLDVQ
jgi:hypothetical protein